MDVTQYLDAVQANIRPLAAVVILAVGVVAMLFGWRFFKVLVALDALILGAYGGYSLGLWLDQPDLALVLAVAIGVVLAAVVWPLMKFAVSVLGALIGSALGFVLWDSAAHAVAQPQWAGMAWIGGLIGLITMGLLAFIIFKIMVMIVMALQGSFMVVTGVVALALTVGPARTWLTDTLTARPYLLPAAVLVPAVLGLILQQTQSRPAPKK